MNGWKDSNISLFGFILLDFKKYLCLLNVVKNLNLDQLAGISCGPHKISQKYGNVGV